MLRLLNIVANGDNICARICEFHGRQQKLVVIGVEILPSWVS